MVRKSKAAETPREGVNTRITKELREKLEAAADAAGRSVGSEIERRLETSFKFNQELLSLFEDERTFHALVGIALSWSDLETATGRKWYDSADSIIAARASAAGILELMRSSDGSSTAKRLADISEDRKEKLHYLGFLSSDRIHDYVKRRPLDGDAAADSIDLSDELFGKIENK